MNGWTGKILRVDLAQGSTRVEDLSKERLQSLIGGRALALAILAEEVDPAADALGDANKLILAAGPLTGTGAACGSVVVCAAKSPLTGGFCCGQVKGHFGAEMKQSGLDAIVFEGKSKFPVYLSMAEGQAKLMPALQAWGRDTRQTTSILHAEIKDNWKARETMVLAIGPAGERKCRLATLVNEDYLAQGAPGLGAVMGAKNLKAVAVRGSNGLSVAHGSAFIDTVSGLINRLGHLPATGQSLPEFGSPYLLDSLAAMGGLAVRNHTAATAEMPSARELAAHYRLARSCFGCPIGCKQFGAVAQGPFASEGKGPEADAVAAFGPKCGVTDPAAIFKANRVCTLYGLDPVSAAGAIACAMELGAAGLMSGVPSFGDAAAMISALDEIGSGQGSLAALGDGAGELCRKAGRPDLFMGVNGAELAPFEPRALPALGLHMATSSLAPSELTAFGLISSAVNGHCPEAPEEAAAACARAQAESAIMDSLGLCALPLVAVPLSELLPMLGAATGWEIRLDEAMDMGAAVVELGRTLNTTAGAPEAALPHRLTDEPLASGPAKGKVCPLNDMLGAYLRRTGAAR